MSYQSLTSMGRRAAAFVLTALVLVGLVVAFRQAGRFLVVSDPLPAHADAIVVLAGAPPARLLAAADLYRSGLAPRVLLTRERRTPATVTLAAQGVAPTAPHDEARQLLFGLGVPAEAVTVLDGRAYSTSSEARLIVRWACRTHARTLVVITSPSHTRRARLILRRLGGPGLRVVVRSASADYFPRRHWWRNRRASKLVLSEYQKLANYWLRERSGLRPCGR
jgi:uncharacterized SAM-binding protein YcdF (DUF218 family)